ncbi:acyl-CoA synthetase [Rhodococcus artemisiae]|uniref:Acyl-CoA synthetase n=1 Tax=Rhodococcus artemisiae TaxID=714159 RepID=A0ABU7LJI6_9NOCA|nr:acyl-CoA synthetase [Rhodococcus artemisiae]MEE2061660.1 acyl-CoA synthetase [Rhodococcus artemisiae]
MYPGKYAAEAPHRPAVVEAATGRILTYRDLEDRSVQFAYWLREQGAMPGDHIAVLTVNDATALEVYWGAVRSGLYVTFVNTHLTPAETAYIVDDCDASILVVSAPLAALAEAIADSTPKVRIRVAFGGDVPGHVDYRTAIATMPTAPPDDQPRGTDMLYSSGTTGRPKGIRPYLTGAQIWEDSGNHVVRTLRSYGFEENSVYFSPAPIYHAAPLRYAAAAIALGGTVVMASRFDAEATLGYLERYRVTHSQWVPTHFVRFMKLPAEVRSRHDMSSMQAAFHAAAPCPVEVKRAMIDWWGEVIYEYYSSTESPGSTTITPQQWLRKPGSVGRAAGGSVVHICSDDGAELPAGEVGQIYFERPGSEFEYYNDPDKTAESRHPGRPGWSTTGDLGYLDDDGFLFLTGRKKFTIISGGVNIYPEEIEAALTVHPKVFDVAVIGVADDEMGESVKAVVQLAPGVDAGEAVASELIEYCRSRVARYKCPRSVEFTAALPRTATGKLLKGALLDASSPR